MYLVGREVGGRRLGLNSAVILALTPMFFQNATIDYTDIPTAFPLTLGLFYILRWWKSDSIRNALWAGILLGVALFTKQSAFTWIASYAAIYVLWLLNSRKVSSSKIRLLSFVALFLPPILIAGGWYIRNYQLTGFVFPISGLYHILGGHTGILGIVPPLAWIRDFGYSLTPLYAIGWVIGLGFAIRQGIDAVRFRVDTVPVHLIFGLIAVPYWLVWWQSFSFEARFLLLILPIMAIWASYTLLWLIDWLDARRAIPMLVTRSLIAVTLLAMFFFASRGHLGAVYYALTRPFASEEDRLRHIQPTLYDLATYIRSHLDPTSDHIMTMDGRLLYYLPEYSITSTYPLRLSDLSGYDYLVSTANIYGIYDGRLGWNQSEFFQHVWDSTLFQSVYESNGAHIMRILRSDVSETP
jgi:4-amino-4-deoxy-L-arabinose transferase-like glycosyltransferase